MENEKFQNVVLEHLVRLTQDLTEFKTETNSQFKDLNARLERVEASVIRIENDHGEKLRALFDAREVQMDVNERLCDSLNRLEGKVDRLVLKVSAHDALLKKAK